jgi:hypothetical protein
VHPSKQCVPNEVTESGILKADILAHPLKQLSAKPTTLSFIVNSDGKSDALTILIVRGVYSADPPTI